jgi:GntR family transcriptional regulator
MFDDLDARSPIPLYEQIAHRLRVAIAAGELVAGEGLPSVRRLATDLRINPATVVQAYRELESEGLVDMRQGAGTYVSEVGAVRRARERAVAARRLVRELMVNSARMGLSLDELKAAIDAEMDGKSA